MEMAGESKSSIAAQQHTGEKTPSHLHCEDAVTVDQQPEVVGMLASIDEVSAVQVEEAAATAPIMTPCVEPVPFESEPMVCDDPVPVSDQTATNQRSIKRTKE